MDQVSVLIDKRLLFGAYPNENMLASLEKLGVTTLVDLTTQREIKKKDKYEIKEDLKYIKYSIIDGKAPLNVIKFEKFISNLIGDYGKGEIIYIHCRGGHGRSSVVSIVLIKLILDLSLNDAIVMVREIHTKRKKMSLKAIKMGIPQTKIQTRFLNDYFGSDIYFYDKSRLYFELSNFYRSDLIIDDIKYKSVEHYYQSQKFVKTCPDFSNIIIGQTTPGKAFYLAKQIKRNRYKWMKDLNIIIDDHTHAKIEPEWDHIKVKIMEKALEAKFTNLDLKNILIKTGTKNIYEDSPRDSFWGLGTNGEGLNMLGLLLVKLRDKLRIIF